LRVEDELSQARGRCKGEADGLVAVLASAPTVGGAGGGLGYAGLTDTIGFEFDTYDNGEVNGNHVGLDIGGNVNSVQTSTNLAEDFLAGKWWNIRIEIDPRPNVKEYRLYAKPVNPNALANSTLGEPVMAGTLAVDSLLPGTKIFIGFTGGTGAAWSRQEVRNISITAPTA
jgi:hypothetical protein